MVFVISMHYQRRNVTNRRAVHGCAFNNLKHVSDKEAQRDQLPTLRIALLTHTKENNKESGRLNANVPMYISHARHAEWLAVGWEL